MLVIPKSWCQLQRPSYGLRDVIGCPGHIQCIYSAYSGFNIQLNVSALLLEISRHCKARYTASPEPNAAHNHQLTQCEMWSRTYTMQLQLRIFRPEYSTEPICAAIEDISTIKCSLYCNLGAKYSVHPTVYAMCTLVTDIYNVITAPHIQARIFN
jgi:hypothetical protein